MRRRDLDVGQSGGSGTGEHRFEDLVIPCHGVIDEGVHRVECLLIHPPTVEPGQALASLLI
ncbi:MAG: hypothetical protein U0R28_07130 [Candidatus Nanopelagicales bacterium]